MATSANVATMRRIAGIKILPQQLFSSIDVKSARSPEKYFPSFVVCL